MLVLGVKRPKRRELIFVSTTVIGLSYTTRPGSRRCCIPTTQLNSAQLSSTQLSARRPCVVYPDADDDRNGDGDRDRGILSAHLHSLASGQVHCQ